MFILSSYTLICCENIWRLICKTWERNFGLPRLRVSEITENLIYCKTNLQSAMTSYFQDLGEAAPSVLNSEVATSLTPKSILTQHCRNPGFSTRALARKKTIYYSSYSSLVLGTRALLHPPFTSHIPFHIPDHILTTLHMMSCDSMQRHQR